MYYALQCLNYPRKGKRKCEKMSEKEGNINENASVEAWICDSSDNVVIVIQTDCGGYYELTIDVEQIKDRFDFVPEGC